MQGLSEGVLEGMFEDYDKYFEDIVKYKIVSFLTFAKEKRKIGATVRAVNLLPCIYKCMALHYLFKYCAKQGAGVPTAWGTLGPCGAKESL